MNKTLFWFSLIVTLAFNITKAQDPYSMIKPKKESHGTNTIIRIGIIGLSTFCDSEFENRYLQFWKNANEDIKPEIIDTVCCSPYSSGLFIYKSKNASDYLIFWVTENEYNSDIHIFYLVNNILNNIGPFPIQKDCETCDDQIYPVNKIKIYGKDNEIIIKLLNPFIYNIGQDNWQKFSPEKTYFTIDKKGGKLIKH